MDIFDDIEALFRKGYSDWEGGTQFDGSGDRLRRLIDEMCWSKRKVDEDIEKSLGAVFKDPYDEMLVAKGINVWTFCPHHVLPCNFKVSIGYIPNGQVLGLSKFARVAVAQGKMPIMQEQYTRELADVLEKALQPKGLGILVFGRHGCMGCRGINQELEIVTTNLRGNFLENPDTKQEFLLQCRKS